MAANPFQVSLDTLLGVAPMLGHALEDRRSVGVQQDPVLVNTVQAHASVRLRDESQCDMFAIAPFDILIAKEERDKRFHILEINGTGIGGLTNMADAAIQAVLDDFTEFAEHLSAENPVVLVASSGKESAEAPRLNRLLHEKVLYVEAMRRGFEASGRPARIVTVSELAEKPRLLAEQRPAIVLGYMKEFIQQLRVDDAGKLFLGQRQVHAAINDRFCLNLLHHFGGRLDLGELQTMNRIFLAGGDKGITYELLNDYLAAHPQACMPAPIRFERIAERDQLIETVVAWVRAGRRTVIKPQGTGLGHGIEFFLSAEEEASVIADRIDASLAQTEELYGLKGGALPYTVCELIDSLTIPRPDHPLYGHRYELRVAVYRDGMQLRPFPSIVKISSERYDAAAPTHLSLINNVTASAQAKKRAGTEFILPLANRKTWELIDLRMEDLFRLCAAVTGFTRYLLDQAQDRPAFFHLPSREEALSDAGQVAVSA